MPRDSATPMPTTSSAAVVDELADDGADLRRADVEARPDSDPYVPHHPPSLRRGHCAHPAVPSVTAAGLPGRTYTRSSNRRSTYSMSGTRACSASCSSEVRLQAFDELLVADVHQRRDPDRAVTTASFGFVTSICEIALQQRRLARRATRSSRAASPARAGSTIGSPVGRRVGRGRRRSADRTARSSARTRRSPVPARPRGRASPPSRAIAIGLPLANHHFDRRRQHAPERRLLDPRRPEQPPPPLVEIGLQDVLAFAGPASSASTSPAPGAGCLARGSSRPQRARVGDRLRRIPAGRRRGRRPRSARRAAAPQARHPRRPPARGLARASGGTACRRGAATATTRSPPESAAPALPIDPAPSVITRSPGSRQARHRAGTSAERLHDVDAAAGARLFTASASARSSRRESGLRPAA